MLIIGVGNDYRGDDAAGLIAARRLAQKAPGHMAVVEQSSEATALMESWRDALSVVVVDAVSSGGKPGSIYRIDLTKEPVPTDYRGVTTHGFGVAEAVRLAQAMGIAPPRLVLYGIEGRCFRHGIGLAPEVEKAVDDVVRLILEEVRCTSMASPET